MCHPSGETSHARWLLPAVSRSRRVSPSARRERGRVLLASPKFGAANVGGQGAPAFARVIERELRLASQCLNASHANVLHRLVRGSAGARRRKRGGIDCTSDG